MADCSYQLHLDLPQPGSSEREIVECYFHRGYTYDDIVLMLARHHDINMHVRTFKRRLQDYGLRRRNENISGNDVQYIREAILREIKNGPGRLNGYRSMWHILRIRYHIHAPRRIVARILRELDPLGVEERKHRSFRRRVYINPGPNFAWHVDGYDKLKRFGFSIHGCIDGFSRRILWLELQKSNKNPKIVAKYFLDYVKASGGCPVRVHTDLGTENGLMAGMQCYFRANGCDQYAGINAHKYVPSTANQRIECFWSSFRKQRTSFWIDFFNDLHNADILDLTRDIHLEALWFSFADILQTELDQVKDYWNSHRIRKSKYSTCAGVPDIMYFLPENYDRTDFVIQVTPDKVAEMQDKLDSELTSEEDEENPIWEDYFLYVMNHNQLSQPTTVQEAGILFETLVNYAEPRVN